MTDIDIPALKAAALESIAERERGPQRIDRLHFITLVDEHAVLTLIERLERAEQRLMGLKRPLPPSGGLCMACAGPVDESGATTADRCDEHVTTVEGTPCACRFR